MSLLLQLEKLTKSYGDRLLFADIDLAINEDDKIGLIAKNGTGKSTFLRIIAGLEDYDSGKITFKRDTRVSMLDQTPEFNESQTPRQFIEEFSEDEEVRTNLLKFITQIGDGLNLGEPFATLSGGQKKRIALAACLAEKPDILILDEPTNHLDIKTIEWLENQLSRGKQTVIIVTHDRYFLERVCSTIVEIDRQNIYSYPGNYSKYIELRKQRIDAMSSELDKVRNILRKEQDWMSRQPQARAGKAKYRIDKFYELKEKSSLNLDEKNIRLTVKAEYIGKKIFSADKVNKRFGEKIVLKDFSYDFARYEKIGIVGENGVGKSTFIKMLQGLIEPDSGHFDVGETISFGYYSQERAVFDPKKRIIDVVTDIAEDINLGAQRLSPLQYLQYFLFTAKDQQKYIENLSGGELSRLYLATVLMKRPNFLILDEPTNDLDIVTLGILEEYLAEFKGCAIIISHDRYFLDNIADHLFVFKGDGIVKDFPGNYSEYLEFLKTLENKEIKTKKNVTVKPKVNRPEKLSYKERKEFEGLLNEIDDLSQKKIEIEKILSSGEIIDDIHALTQKYQEICDNLDEKELRWLELSEKA